MKKLLAKIRGKAMDLFYSQVPRLAKIMGATYGFAKKVLTNMIWVGIVAIPIEVICRQWSMIWCTLAAMAASMAAAEAVRMRKAFKAWGFGDGPNG